jgi:SAM-dependent MidA family methyltransferase
MAHRFDREPTALFGTIQALIDSGGPIGVDRYFHLCVADPEHGYYRTREPFGTAGDFVTAPEISQLFGEMIGLFLVQAWQGAGWPTAMKLCELGPGRGTLMADILRVLKQVAPTLYAACEVHLVETSERLRAIQAATLSGSGKTIAWHERIEEVPAGPALIVANEFLDALPVRQFVMRDGRFLERVVALDGDRLLKFGVADAQADATLPDDAGRQPEGTIYEQAPLREAVALTVADRLVRQDGLALFIDYGHIVSGYGDTLQAVRRQAFDDPLAHPGEADLTSHVDFEAIAAACDSVGAQALLPMTQGDFLIRMGLVERAGQLGRGKSAAQQAAISEAVERLAGHGPGKMGELFKVLAVTGSRTVPPPFRARPT